MGRKSEGPWWNAQKGKWYVWHEGRKVSLGTSDEQEAVRRWHRIMAGDAPGADAPKPVAPPTPAARGVTVRRLADAFLEGAEDRMSADCKRNYALFLSALTARHGGDDAETLTAVEVERVSRKPKWSASYRAGFVACVATAFRWGVAAKLLATNPVADMKTPARVSRGAEAVISEAVHRTLLAHADPIFADFLQLLWLTGARPGELASLTADAVRRMSHGVLPLKEHKLAHRGKSRTLILSPDAVAILQRRVAACTGRLFPWSRKAVTSRMDSLRKKAGVTGVIAYGYRHTFATDALANGVPDATVAALLGHCDTSMIHRHYSHLSSRTAALKDAVDKVRG